MRRVACASLLIFSFCATNPARDTRAAPQVSPLIDEVQHRTFQWFWDNANPQNGLVPDRWPTKSFSSVAAIGFGLTAYGIGAEHGWITREQARERVLTTLRFFWNAPQTESPANVTGYRGFFYHFLDMDSGYRYKTVELSTVDTALFVAGALFCQQYFNRDDAAEREIRDLAEKIYERIDWSWTQQHTPAITMGWTPEEKFGSWEYRGYNESMLLYILGLGSPTHPLTEQAWAEYTKSYRWGQFYGYPMLNFAPLFGHQYSHIWIDFRGIRDAYMREKGIDYFENSRRATLAQRAYAMDNPADHRGYGENMWGLSACDGPVDRTIQMNFYGRTFQTYAARGAARGDIRDDGTITPTAAISSIAFTPEVSIPAMEEMSRRFGDRVYTKYGFIDSFNETLDVDVPVQMGHIVPGVAWFDNDYLGIDQGPIVAMIENYRSGLVWKLMRNNPHIVRGLQRAGFTGGWLQN